MKVLIVNAGSGAFKEVPAQPICIMSVAFPDIFGKLNSMTLFNPIVSLKLREWANISTKFEEIILMPVAFLFQKCFMPKKNAVRDKLTFR